MGPIGIGFGLLGGSLAGTYIKRQNYFNFWWINSRIFENVFKIIKNKNPAKLNSDWRQILFTFMW
jgi:hypothetical protein